MYFSMSPTYSRSGHLCGARLTGFVLCLLNALDQHQVSFSVDTCVALACLFRRDTFCFGSLFLDVPFGQVVSHMIWI